MDLEQAKKRLAEIQERSRAVIFVMTVEQALLARQLIRQGGKK